VAVTWRLTARIDIGGILLARGRRALRYDAAPMEVVSTTIAMPDW
jgi:hypothetical protein